MASPDPGNLVGSPFLLHLLTSVASLRPWTLVSPSFLPRSGTLAVPCPSAPQVIEPRRPATAAGNKVNSEVILLKKLFKSGCDATSLIVTKESLYP